MKKEHNCVSHKWRRQQKGSQKNFLFFGVVFLWDVRHWFSCYIIVCTPLPGGSTVPWSYKPISKTSFPDVQGSNSLSKITFINMPFQIFNHIFKINCLRKQWYLYIQYQSRSIFKTKYMGLFFSLILCGNWKSIGHPNLLPR